MIKLGGRIWLITGVICTTHLTERCLQICDCICVTDDIIALKLGRMVHLRMALIYVFN